MAVVTIKVPVFGGEATVWSPFEAKDVIKSMPQRTWDKALKCWRVPTEDVPLLEELLRSAGFRVVITRERWEQPYEQAPPPRAGRTARTWADDMFTALGPELSRKAYGALVKVLHPDVGGSTEAMQVLNQARDQAGLAA